MRDFAAIGRKITFTLFLSQSIFSAGWITTATVNAIVGAELSGVVAWAGVPTAVFLVATALSAFIWGFVMERVGRRGGLTAGLTFGVVGAAMAGSAIVASSFVLFLAGMAFMGVAQASMQLGRFAAAEVHPPEARGRAIANVVLGGTIGAILGPLMVGPAGRLAAGAGLSEITGPYGASILLVGLVILLIFFRLRPEPMRIARELERQAEEQDQTLREARPIAEILRSPAVIVAVTAMVIGQVVMVMLMVITSLHMKDYNHSLTDISVVISAHTFGMFAFSIISGRLVDRIGREKVILMGALILVVASLAARLSPDVLPLAVALFLLGLGWNFSYVGGSTLLTDQLSSTEQARTQGFNDLLIGLASAVGSLGSGFVYSVLGYNAMGFVGAIVALVPLSVTLWWGRRRMRLRTV
jgi:MFS family permease